VLLGPLRRFFGSRQRSQGLVEYGLITACLAFVGLAGFNALAGAQKNYLQEFPKNAPVPAAPGSLLHATAVDDPDCTPLTPTKVGVQIQCHSTVTDEFNDPASDRKRPWGTINFYLDNSSLVVASCTLPNLPPSSGFTNDCTANWTPTGSGMVGSHILRAKFDNPTSNHLASIPSAALSLQFIPNLQWTVACPNQIEPLPVGVTEIGHPLKCTATVKDLASGTPTSLPLNSPITWSTDNGAVPGVGMFTCTSPYNIWTDSANCPSPAPLVPLGTASFSCFTDASSSCSVVYRRIFDSMGGGGGTTPPLSLTTSAGGPPYIAYVQILPPQYGAHGTHAVAVCNSADANVTMRTDPITTPSVSFGNAEFQSTFGMDVKGTMGTQITCTATVLDGDPNPAATSGDPNLGDAYPPRGTVTFKFDGASKATCSLQRVDFAAAPTQQAPGQAPFMSTCSTMTTPFSITGIVNGPLTPCDGATAMGCIDVEYSGNSSHAALTNGWPSTSHDTYQIPVSFNP
jgi:hypothetical protein